MALLKRLKECCNVVNHSQPSYDIETRQGPVKKPKIVCEYNLTIGEVDKVRPTGNGVKKYYKTVSFHLMDVAVWNAFILHQKTFTQSGKKSYT